MSRLGTRMMLIVLSAWVLVAEAQAADPEDRLLQLKSAYADFAIDPDTGSVVAVDPKAGQAILYPKAYFDARSADVVGPTDVGKSPSSVIFKRYKDKSWFIVASDKANQMILLDPKTLKEAKRIALGTSQVTSLMTSLNPDDPHVYYVYGREDDGSLGDVRLDDMADKGKVALQEHDEVMDAAVSADGMHLYPRGPYSPSGFDAYRAKREPGSWDLTWVKVHDEHRSTSVFVADPFGLSVASGNRLYSADLAQQLAEFDYTVACFFPDRPVIVGIAAESLAAGSYNDFKAFGKKALPAKLVDLGELQDYGRNEWRDAQAAELVARQASFLPDPKEHRLIVACGSRAWVVPLSTLGVKDEVLLVADVDVPPVLSVNAKTEIPVKPRDKRATVTLKEGPAGLDLSGGKLTWTPRTSQVGQAKVVLQVKHDESVKTQNFALDVAQDSVRLGFSPAGIDISPSGKWAVVWTGAGQRDPWGDRADRPARSQIALIDVKTQKALIEKELLYAVTTAAVDDLYIYVAPAQSDRINALTHKDLTREKHSMTNGPVTDITLISPKLMAALTTKGLSTFSLPELVAAKTPASSPELNEDQMDDYRWRMREEMLYRRRMMRMMGGGGMDMIHPFLLQRLREGWFAGGALYNADMTKPLMLVGPGDLPCLEVDRQASMKIPMPWDRTIRDGALVTLAGQQIGNVGNEPTLVLVDHPAVVSLSVSDGSDGKFAARLGVRDLLSAETVESITLFEEKVGGGRDRVDWEILQATRRQYGTENVNNFDVVSVGKTVLALVGNRVYIHAISDETLKKCTLPFEFQPLDGIVTIDVEKKNTLKHVMRGGAEPFEFEMTATHDGVGIDPKTGIVTVDGPKVFEEARSLLIDRMSERRSYDDEGAAATPRQMVNVMAREIKDRYREITGQESKGIPVLLPIGVTASDRNQQVTAMDYQAVIIVPDDAVTKVVTEEAEKTRAEEEARRLAIERQREEYERRRQEAIKAMGERTKTGSGTTDERLRELEERVRLLEAKIDMLIRILQDGQMDEPDTPRKKYKDQGEKKPASKDADY